MIFVQDTIIFNHSIYLKRIIILYYTHKYVNFSANSPINPFLSTIAKQRGYSSSVFGNILTLLLLLIIVVKPLTGYITDRWKCRRTVFLCAILLNGLLTPTLYLIPGATSSTGELSNAETFGSLQFWWFATVVILRMILFMVGEVLQETICIRILGTFTVKSIIIYGSKLILSGLILCGRCFKNTDCRLKTIINLLFSLCY